MQSYNRRLLLRGLAGGGADEEDCEGDPGDRSHVRGGAADDWGGTTIGRSCSEHRARVRGDGPNLLRRDGMCLGAGTAEFGIHRELRL